MCSQQLIKDTLVFAIKSSILLAIHKVNTHFLPLLGSVTHVGEPI